MIRRILLFVLLSQVSSINAQNLPLNGKIEFEKKINKFALIEKDLKNYSTSLNEEFSKYKTLSSQFLVLKSNLVFSVDKSLFTPLANNNDRINNIWNGKSISEQLNIVYNDFSKSETTIQKEISGETYLIKDEIRAIKWKITDQTRKIIGYNCRRANGLIMDSIYVVAFFTNEIPIQAGPESFNGLPGMILGVALPYENVSWFATKVDLTISQEVIPPFKGKPTSFKIFHDLLEKIFKSFNNRDNKIKDAML